MPHVLYTVTLHNYLRYAFYYVLKRICKSKAWAVFSKTTIAFDEVIIAFDEVIIAFDEVIIAFDEVIIAFDEVIIAFDEVIIAFDEVIRETQIQGRIQPISLEEAIPVIFGSKVS